MTCPWSPNTWPFRSFGRVYLLQNFANYDSRELNLQAVASADDVLEATLEVSRPRFMAKTLTGSMVVVD